MSTKSDIWMPIYIGDLLGDTQHLTDEQFGKYHKILYHQWRHGHFSEEELWAISGFSGPILESASSTTQAELKQAFSRVLAPLKQLLSKDQEGLWFSRRCDLEKVKWFEKKRVFTERARKGGLAKARRIREEIAASSSASSVLEGVLEGCTSPSQEVQEQRQKLPPTPVAARRGIEAAELVAEQVSPAPIAAVPGVSAGEANGHTKPASIAAVPGVSPAPAKSEQKGKATEMGARARLNGRDDVSPVGGRAASVAASPGGKNGGKNSMVGLSKAVQRADRCKSEVLAYWRGQNPKHPKCPWGEADDRALGALLRASPDLSVQALHELLTARAHSDVNPAALPHKWLRNIQEFASGSLGRYGKPLPQARKY